MYVCIYLSLMHMGGEIMLFPGKKETLWDKNLEIMFLVIFKASTRGSSNTVVVGQTLFCKLQ